MIINENMNEKYIAWYNRSLYQMWKFAFQDLTFLHISDSSPIVNCKDQVILLILDNL